MKIILSIFALTLFFVMPIQGKSKELYISGIAISDQSPEKMIEDGMQMILNALELFIQEMPKYEKPEILENGDIIIRRVDPDQRKPSEMENDRGKTDTKI